MSTEVLSKREIAAAVANLPDNMAVCRDLRHAWTVDTPFYLVKHEGGPRGARYAERRRGCMRCQCEVVELFRVHSSWMEKLSERRVYPDGYLLHGLPKGTNVAAIVRRRAFEAANGLSR
jgi:hypothetical protein